MGPAESIVWVLLRCSIVPTCLLVIGTVFIWLFIAIPDVFRQIVFGKKGTLPRKLPTNSWTIHGKTYDLSAWAKEHPGGKWAIESTQNSDCTALFESYHVFIDHSKLMKMLTQFEVKCEYPTAAVARESLPVGDASLNHCGLQFCDAFHEDVKKMLRTHFQGKSHKMKPEVAGLLLIVFFVALVTLRFYFQRHTWAVVALPSVAWTLAPNVAHDGNHFAASKHHWINAICSYSATPFFFSSTTWYLQHTVQHHAHTNDKDDVDLYHFLPVMRASLFTEWSPIFKLQWFTCLLESAMVAFHLQFIVPTDLLTGQIDAITGKRRYSQAKNVEDFVARHRSHIIFELLICYTWVILNFAWLGFAQGAFQLALSWSVSSCIFIAFTQLAHLQEQCMLGEVETCKSWAKRQAATSVNFRTDSFFWYFISGGLNLQSIHHVAPGVSESHLMDIYPKFKDVCSKHGVELKEVPSMAHALRGVMKWITKLATPNPCAGQMADGKSHTQ